MGTIANNQIRCPYCGSGVEIRAARDVFGNKDTEGYLCVCKNYPECNSYVHCHPDTKTPMGNLANKKLRQLRKKAHMEFDKLYLSNIMSRKDAYSWLKLWIQAPGEEAHIGHLSEYYCEVVIKESKKLYESMQGQKNTRIRNYHSYKKGV